MRGSDPETAQSRAGAAPSGLPGIDNMEGHGFPILQCMDIRTHMEEGGGRPFLRQYTGRWRLGLGSAVVRGSCRLYVEEAHRRHRESLRHISRTAQWYRDISPPEIDS